MIIKRNKKQRIKKSFNFKFYLNKFFKFFSLLFQLKNPKIISNLKR